MTRITPQVCLKRKNIQIPELSLRLIEEIAKQQSVTIPFYKDYKNYIKDQLGIIEDEQLQKTFWLLLQKNREIKRVGRVNTNREIRKLLKEDLKILYRFFYFSLFTDYPKIKMMSFLRNLPNVMRKNIKDSIEIGPDFEILVVDKSYIGSNNFSHHHKNDSWG